MLNMNTNQIYVINPTDAYFVVNGLSLDTQKLTELGCTLVSTRTDLYEHAMRSQPEMNLSDFEGTEFIVQANDEQKVVILGCHGGVYKIEGDIEAYISSFGV